VDQELISRREIEGLLFSVGDIVVLLSWIVELLGGDIDEEGTQG